MKSLLCCMVVVLCNVVSVSFADDMTPTISSVSLSPEISAAGDMVYVTVHAQDDTGISSVTADSVPLQLVNNAWQGSIMACSTNGLHNVTVIATDNSGNTSCDAESHYTTLPVVGISNSDAVSETAKFSTSKFLFKVWGRATYVDGNYFDVDDGSGNPLRVLEPGHIVRTGDYVTSRGQLKCVNDNVYLEASYYDIPEFVDGRRIVDEDAQLGNHFQRAAIATLSNPATKDLPIMVNLTSLDPGLLLLASDDDPTPRTNVSLSANYSYIYYTIVGNASCGTARIAAISSDGQRGILRVNLFPTGFVFYGDSSISFNKYTGDAYTSIQISCALLDPVTHAVLYNSQCLSYNTTGVKVALSNLNPAVVTLVDNPLVIDGWESPYMYNEYYTARIKKLEYGSTAISLSTPTGFTTPSEKQQLTLNVVHPKIDDASADIGCNLQLAKYVSFQTGPSSTADVTLSVDDESIATLSTDPLLEGSKTVILTGAKSGFAKYYVQGCSIGTTNLTISAPEYTPASSTITVNPSGFVLDLSSITTNKYAANTSIAIKSAMLSPDTLSILQYQNLRGGLSVDIPIDTSDAGVGIVTTNPATITANSSSATDSFDPVGVGSCVISLGTPHGFQIPSGRQTLTAIVNIPCIKITSVQKIGCNLQAAWALALESAPPESVDITVSIDDSSIALISDSSSIQGNATLVFENASTTSSKTFYVQGVSIGETDIRISAPGFSDTVKHIVVYPSGFVFGPYFPIYTKTSSANTLFYISSGFYNPTNGGITYQPLRAGAESANVMIECSDTSVGNVTVSPLSFTAGASRMASYFDPLAAGTCVLSIIQPDGYQNPGYGQALDPGRLTVNVTE
ncbi:MAG: hypothetical protein ABFD49_00170 [Armatimonadota bacterium]|nr:hypothetical protein [bacterium]